MPLGPAWGINLNGMGFLINAFEDLRMEVDTDQRTLWVVRAGDVSKGVDYATFVENGTSRMEAQPFFGPAIRETVREWDSVVGDRTDPDDIAEIIALEIERKAKAKVPVDTGSLHDTIRAERA